MVSRPRSGSIRAAALDLVLGGAVVLVAFTAVSKNRPHRLLVGEPDWRALVTSDLVIGPPKAKVTVVEFVDYQCPVCATMEPVLAELQREYPQALRRVVHHFPIPRLHPEAQLAALAVQCAAPQGRFGQMHAAVLGNQGLVGKPGGIDSLAQLARVPDHVAMTNCMRLARTDTLIANDRSFGAGIGVTGTPTFIVNREWLQGVSAPELRTFLLAKLN
jgi:protein-disulfide isomerase